MKKRREFLAGDRFEDDNRAYEKDRRLLHIRGQETSDETRHIVAKVTEKPRSVSAKPKDNMSDPELAEGWTALVETALADPYVSFDTVFERALLACREEAQGIVWMDYDPECRDIFKLKYRWAPPDRMMWDPAYWDDPHHPDCGWLLEICRMPVEKARQMYNADWLEADHEADPRSASARPDQPLLQNGTDRLPYPIDDDQVTLWKCWYKNDPTERPTPTKRTSTKLPPGERYMKCMSGCGYKSDTQDELQASGAIQGDLPANLPAASPENPSGGCPTCGGELRRVNAVDTLDYQRQYTKGRRLIITAPYNKAPDAQPVYDGDWPIPTARSFPGFFITPYPKPGECDTDYHWDQQIASDQLRTLAIQRVFEHRKYWILPAAGITDAKGKRFRFKEDQHNIMYRDANSQGPLNVESVDGTGLDPGWQVAFNATQAALTQFRSVADFGPSDERTRDIAVGTTNQIVRQAETPTAHFRRRINRELGKFYGVVSDYIDATLDPMDAMRLGIEGIEAVIPTLGQGLNNLDFVLEDTPEFTGLDEARNNAWQALMATASQAFQIGIDPVAAIEVAAEIQQFPKSVTKKVVKLFMQAQQQQQMNGGLPLPGGMSGPGGLVGGGLPGPTNGGPQAADITSALGA